MASVLVSGSSGLLGKHLIRRLVVGGHDVHLLARQHDDVCRLGQVHPGLPVVSFDNLTARAPPPFDVIVHLAGLARATGSALNSGETTAMIAANVVPTRRLVNYAKHTGVKAFIHASSIFAVSGNTSDKIIDDHKIRQPTTPYGASKSCAEDIVAELPASGCFAVSLRMPLVIAPDASGNWALLQRLAASRLPLPFAGINNQRSILCVETACAAIEHLVARRWDIAKSGPYALAEREPVSLPVMIGELRKGSGRNAGLFPVPAAVFRAAGKLTGKSRMVDSLIGDLIINPQRFYTAFAFAPQTTPMEAIRASVCSNSPVRQAAGQNSSYPGKRILDLAIALPGAIVSAPILFLLGITIRLETPGPALFRQVRVGRHGRPFVCYKLRTMTIDTRDAPSHEVSASQVTRVGAVLRRLKLDELPQFWNILRNEMSLVGPRPCLPSQTELIAERRLRGVDCLLPGVTGIAQVAGIDMSHPVELAKIDQAYMSEMSLSRDINLIWRTALGSGRGDRIRAARAGS